MNNSTAVFTITGYGPRLMFHDNIPHDIKTVFATDPDVVLTKENCYEIKDVSKIVELCEYLISLGYSIEGNYFENLPIREGYWYIDTDNIKYLGINNTDLLSVKDGRAHILHDMSPLDCREFVIANFNNGTKLAADFRILCRNFEIVDKPDKLSIDEYISKMYSENKDRLSMIKELRAVYMLNLRDSMTTVDKFLATR